MPNPLDDLMSGWLWGAVFLLVVALGALFLLNRTGRRGSRSVLTPPDSMTEESAATPTSPGRAVQRVYEDQAGPAPGEGLALDVDAVLGAAMTVHEDRVREARHLLREARVGTLEERLYALERAEQGLHEAEAARGTESGDAAELLAHVAYARSRLLDSPDESEAALRRSAEEFIRATRLRPLELDAFMGAGAVWYDLATRWEEGEAVAAFDVSAGSYQKAFSLARNNLKLMRGWAAALQGLYRLREVEGAEERLLGRRAAFDNAMAEHRNGEHELRTWFDDLLADRVTVDPPEVELI